MQCVALCLLGKVLGALILAFCVVALSFAPAAGEETALGTRTCAPAHPLPQCCTQRLRLAAAVCCKQPRMWAGASLLHLCLPAGAEGPTPCAAAATASQRL